MNYLYLSIYSLISVKSIWGRGQVSSTLFALCIFNNLSAIFVWLEYYGICDLINPIILGAIYVILFILCRLYFLDTRIYKKNIKSIYRYRSRVLKLVGVIILFVSFISPIISAVSTTLLKNIK